MKKVLLLCCIVILSFFSVGCAKTIELTEEENHLIAEYAAELLLKYDRNIKQKYNTDTHREFESSEEDIAITTEEISTESITTEESTTQSQNTEEDDVNTTESDSSKNDSQVITSDADKNFDIAILAGEDNLSIKYSHYMILDQYPSYDHDGVYIEITAPTGYNLLVVKFNVENRTNENQHVDLYSKNLDYSIIVNNSKSAKQMLTILIDDLYTYQVDIDASSTQEAVLLFQVSESVANSIEDLKLSVKNGSAEKVIQLQ